MRPGRRCRMSRRALPARFPPRPARARGPALAALAGRCELLGLIDSWGRPHGFAPHRTYVSASLVKAMLLVAYLRGIGNRAPDAGERGSLGPDDHGLLERRGGHDLLPRRRRGPRSARRAGRHEDLLRGRLLGERPLQRRGPGALLQPDRPAGAEGVARVRARPPVLDRELPALGLLALLAAPRASGRSSRAAGAERAPGSSCTRRRCSSAGERGSRWRCSPTGTRRTTTGPRRCAEWHSASSGRPRRSAHAGGRRAEQGGTRATRRAGPRGRPPLRAGIRVNLSYRTKRNETGARAARLLRELGADARAGRLQPGPGAAPPPPRAVSAS